MKDGQRFNGHGTYNGTTKGINVTECFEERTLHSGRYYYTLSAQKVNVRGQITNTDTVNFNGAWLEGKFWEGAGTFTSSGTTWNAT